MPQKTEKFVITDMHCASCAVKNANTLKKLEGVKDARVNYATSKAQITYDSDKTAPTAFKKAVSDLGYTLKISGSNEKEDGHAHHSSESTKQEQHKSHMAHGEGVEKSKQRFMLSAIMTFPFLLFLFGVTIPGAVGFVPANHFVQLVLATFIVWVPGIYFHKDAWRGLKHASANMNSLISLGSLAAYFYSIYIVFIGGNLLFFETAAFIITLILLGKYFEERSKGKANESIKKLMALGAKYALVLQDGKEIEKSVGKVAVGEMIRVKPGSTVPLDGEVARGESHVDESMLTGESKTVGKEVSSTVFGGTLNTDGSLDIRVTKQEKDSALAQVVKLVEEAQMYKAPMEKLTDRVSSIFTPSVVTISALTLFGWGMLSGNWNVAFVNAVAVLIVACPCALGLATPTAVMVGTGRGAKEGILIKNGEALERAKKIDMVLFDKTGTLTKGKPEVVDVLVASNPTTFSRGGREWSGYSKDELLQIAASVEQHSEHPLARAITKSYTGELLAVEHFQNLKGKGVTADIGGKNILIAKPIYSTEQNITYSQKDILHLQEQGKTVVIIAVDGVYAGAIAIADATKKGAKEAVTKLTSQGIAVGMVTGDNQATATAIAKKLGIEEVFAEVLPQDKLAKVQELQQQGKKIAFVGDGVNDAPALTAADLGIAMGTGTDVAIAAGHLVLMHGSPTKAVEALELSRETFSTIKQNLWWAFGYNMALIPLAVAGFVHPTFAAAAMSFSSVSVVLNSLRLRTK